eukprot:TRINITY_DN39153_c0_g1_i1.p1 TRINITY_DN39153_c0_g1~~TRINITY_DN39153_c0_g1_i1.p1  ORF type:complete len:293 (-),score=43.10 TRINITY_DN39153_c0_g1_i1:114-992(-)
MELCARRSLPTAESVLRELGGRLAGKSVLVTGATGGLSRALCAQLVHTPLSRLLLHCRKQAQAEKLAQELGPTAVELVPVSGDLSSLASVRRLAAQVAQGGALDGVVAGAGIATLPQRELTEDGFEKQLAVNHLAHFLLLELVTLRPDARVVLVATGPPGVERFTVDFDDLQSEKSYSLFKAYAQSKICNVLHARQLAAHGVRAIAVDPGTVPDTGIARHLSPALRFCFRYIGPGLFGKTPEQGAATLAHGLCADIPSGYYTNLSKYELKGVCSDPEVAKKLWDVSKALVKQ